MEKYPYKAVTHKQLTQLVKSWQNRLCLRDWTIHLNTGVVPCREMKLWISDEDETPDYMFNGLSYVLADRLEAYVWIPLESLKEDNENPREVLLHELLHVLFAAYQEEEVKVRILASLVFGQEGEERGTPVGDGE